MRKALVVGINYYSHISCLNGCLEDAFSVKNVLEYHADGTRNFDVKIETASDSQSAITRVDLKGQIKALFEDDNDIALLYFSGHGHIDAYGGYIISSDTQKGDDGLSMSEILKIVNESKARNKIVILDCCHSGALGSDNTDKEVSKLSSGVTIMAASAANQYALENDEGGVFTKLFVDALNGGAANLLGDITPGSIYAHVDLALGAWNQRPIFKSNVKAFVPLRKHLSSVDLMELREITSLFPVLGEEHKLDPEYEYTEKHGNKEKERQFRIMQNFNRVNLVVPVGEEDMYWAAMHSKSCKLTVLGEYYWKLIDSEKI